MRYTVIIFVSFVLGFLASLVYTKTLIVDAIRIQSEYHIGQLEWIAYKAFENSESSTAIWLMKTYEEEISRHGPSIYEDRIYKLKKILINLALSQLFNEVNEIDKSKKAFELAKLLSDEFEDVQIREINDAEPTLRKFDIERGKM